MANFLSPDFMTLSESLEITQHNDLASFLKPLEKKSNFMKMCPWYPSSDGSLHKGSRVTLLPEGKNGHINGPIASGKMGGMAYQETVKMFELESTVDSRLFEHKTAEEAEKLRMTKDQGDLKGYMQSFAKNVLLSDGKAADDPIGFINRRKKLSDYCKDMGGVTSGKLGSLFFIRFGEDGVNLRYPSNAGNGFTRDDKGELLTPIVEAGTPGWMYAFHSLYRTFYMPDLADDKAFIRAANIPTDAKMTDVIMDKLIEIVNETLEDDGEGYICLGPPNLVSQFQKYLKDKNNINFSQKEIEGMGKPTFLLNVPFFKENYLLTNETKIV